MSVLVYCLLLILCLDPSNGRHVEVIDTELHDQKYHIPGKGWVQDHVKKGEHRKSISPSSATLLLLEEIEDTQAINNDFSGNENTSSPDQVAAKTEEWKRQPPMTKKKNNDDFVEEVEVTDYAKSHRKPHRHILFNLACTNRVLCKYYPLSSSELAITFMLKRCTFHGSSIKLDTKLNQKNEGFCYSNVNYILVNQFN